VHQGKVASVHWARGLAAPVAVNVVVALACYGLFGAATGWSAPGRAAFPSWFGNGLPLVQFLAMAYLANRVFRILSGNVLNGGRPAIPLLGQQLISAVIYFSFAASSISVVFNESISGVLAASGIVGLAVGFAIRGLLADVFSGIALNLDPGLAPGNWLDVSVRGREVAGKLVEIRWRTVVIADRSENLVLIPNSEFATAFIVNRSHPAPATEYKATVPVGVENDTARVVAVLETALKRCVAEGALLEAPAPYVRLNEPAQGQIPYAMFYCLDLDRVSPAKGRSIVVGHAVNFLKAAGISLHPTSHAELGRPKSPGQDRHTEMATRLRVLADVPMLSVLSQAELHALAEASTVRFLSPGEPAMEAGEPGESMFVVVEGRLEVVVDERPVATLWPGECAGEMSLLTGSPRSATVAAAGPACVLEVGKEALTPLLRTNPTLAERIAAVVEKRRARAAGSGSGARDSGRRKDDGDNLVSKIRRFFKL
jgi:small-conductance mechanosensitive channel/CRP-like cAMP-binding protein